MTTLSFLTWARSFITLGYVVRVIKKCAEGEWEARRSGGVVNLLLGLCLCLLGFHDGLGEEALP